MGRGQPRVSVAEVPDGIYSWRLNIEGSRNMIRLRYVAHMANNLGCYRSMRLPVRGCTKRSRSRQGLPELPHSGRFHLHIRWHVSLRTEGELVYFVLVLGQQASDPW